METTKPLSFLHGFISEAIISKYWRGRIESLNMEIGDGQQRINRERKDYLMGRDFPVSLVSNMLELWGILPFISLKTWIQLEDSEIRSCTEN